MAVDDTNLLTKVNLNGTELVIADTYARQRIEEGGTVVEDIASMVTAHDDEITKLENKSNSFITATYDAQSSTLSLTSKS